MAKALVTGSFDPVTLGHMDLITRAARIFENVVVGIFVNSSKVYTFDAEERAAMIEEACAEAGLTNVNVEICTGMVAHYVRDIKIEKSFDYSVLTKNEFISHMIINGTSINNINNR